MLRIVLKEGKAIRATEDMRLFADEILRELRPFLKEPLLIFSEVNNFYWRSVKGPHDVVKKIGIRFQQHENAKSWTVLDSSELRTGTSIRLYYKIKKNGDPVIVSPPTREEIIHELIHAFDPKLIKGVSYKGEYTPGVSSESEYFSDQSEQDAYMRQDAIVIAKELGQVPAEEISELLKSRLSVPKKPLNQAERRLKVWSQDTKMWRKFINTVYDEVISRKLPKVSPSKFQQAKADREGLTP